MDDLNFIWIDTRHDRCIRPKGNSTHRIDDINEFTIEELENDYGVMTQYISHLENDINILVDAKEAIENERDEWKEKYNRLNNTRSPFDLMNDISREKNQILRQGLNSFLDAERSMLQTQKESRDALRNIMGVISSLRRP